MIRSLAVAVVMVTTGGRAMAEHDHAFMMAQDAHHDPDAPVSQFSASVSLEAARFDTGTYVGSYQGLLPTVGWSYGRFGVDASLGLYRLEENGLEVSGIGDAMASARLTVWSNEDLQTGVLLHLMVPTGDELENLGMGHSMLMSSGWIHGQVERVSLTASAGYSRALISLGGSQHNHGPMPLVDPMNLQEIAWSAGADVEVGARVHVGGHLLGGAPIGTGTNRVIGGGRVGWGTRRVSTDFELQAGLAGDPFSIRGVLETALRF